MKTVEQLLFCRRIANYFIAMLSLSTMLRAGAEPLPGPPTPTGVIGVSEDMLAPDYWIASLLLRLGVTTQLTQMYINQ